MYQFGSLAPKTTELTARESSLLQEVHKQAAQGGQQFPG